MVRQFPHRAITPLLVEWLTPPLEYGHGHSTTAGGAGTHGSNLTHGGIGQSSTSGDPLHSGRGTDLSRNDMTGRTTDSDLGKLSFLISFICANE